MLQNNIMSRKPILRVYFIICVMVFIFERFFFQISQGSTAHGILRKQQVPHPMETIKMEHSREIWSKTTAWAGHPLFPSDMHSRWQSHPYFHWSAFGFASPFGPAAAYPDTQTDHILFLKVGNIMLLKSLLCNYNVLHIMGLLNCIMIHTSYLHHISINTSGYHYLWLINDNCPRGNV